MANQNAIKQALSSEANKPFNSVSSNPYEIKLSLIVVVSSKTKSVKNRKISLLVNWSMKGLRVDPSFKRNFGLLLVQKFLENLRLKFRQFLRHYLSLKCPSNHLLDFNMLSI